MRILHCSYTELCEDIISCTHDTATLYIGNNGRFLGTKGNASIENIIRFTLNTKIIYCICL